MPTYDDIRADELTDEEKADNLSAFTAMQAAEVEKWDGERQRQKQRAKRGEDDEA